MKRQVCYPQCYAALPQALLALLSSGDAESIRFPLFITLKQQMHLAHIQTRDQCYKPFLSAI